MAQFETPTMNLSRPETPRSDIAAISEGLDLAIVRTVVVVPTYRRPAMLRDTLESLAAQTGEPFAVLVVENDAIGREGLAEARDMFAFGRIAGFAIVETSPGNVSAINAGFAMALDACPQAENILMIDDDEIASPGWLSALVGAARSTGADIVGGPALPAYAEVPSAEIAQHPVFRAFHMQTGPVRRLFGSGNVLVRRPVFETLGQPFFDRRFNYLGGGDADFFVRAERAGFRSYWVHEASVVETVPADRTTRGWIVRRGLRTGAINRAIDMKAAEGLAGRARVLAKDIAILGLSPFRAARLLAATRSPFIASHPIIVAIGRISSAFGLEPHQYGQDKPS